MMEYINAPWRMSYIESDKEDSTSPKEKSACIFCDFLSQSNDEQNLILVRGEHAFVMMNRYPYNTGHLMVIPTRHTADLTSLSQAESAEIFSLIQHCLHAMGKAMSPQAYNIGFNLGRTAGAGIDQHLHAHIVPRWAGDTNFMTVTADTRVVPEALEVTYKKLLAQW